MSTEQIKIISLRPRSNSKIKPEGIHLRWTFPAHLGFPSDGFEVLRDGDSRIKLPLPKSPDEMTNGKSENTFVSITVTI